MLSHKSWSHIVTWLTLVGHVSCITTRTWSLYQFGEIVIKKLVNWLTKTLYEISHLSCYDQYFLLMHDDQLRPTFWLTLINFLFWVKCLLYVLLPHQIWTKSVHFGHVPSELPTNEKHWGWPLLLRSPLCTMPHKAGWCCTMQAKTKKKIIH